MTKELKDRLQKEAREFMAPHRPYTTEMKMMVAVWESDLDAVVEGVIEQTAAELKNKNPTDR